MSEEIATTIACGAAVDDLLEQVADRPGSPRTDHQRGCVHCQAALAEFESLWAPLHAAAGEDVHAPEGLVERVLDRMRAAVGSPEWAVLVQAGGRTRVGIDVVLTVVRVTAAGVTGVRALLPAASTPADDGEGGGARVGIVGSTVAIEVTVAADYGQDLLALGEELSRQISGAVAALVGVSVAAVTVHIDDVLQR